LGETRVESALAIDIIADPSTLVVCIVDIDALHSEHVVPDGTTLDLVLKQLRWDNYILAPSCRGILGCFCLADP